MTEVRIRLTAALACANQCKHRRIHASVNRQKGRRNCAAFLTLLTLMLAQPNANAQRTTAANFDTELSRAAGIKANDGFDFGDVTNYYTGETSFSVLGATLKGNNDLPVGRPSILQAYDDGRGLVFRWESPGPYLSGTYSKEIGWTTDAEGDDRFKICSRPNASASAPIVPSNSGKEGAWEPEEYWKGITLHIDGNSVHLNAVNGTIPNMPTAGGPYKWATNNGWFFSCITLPSGGEGFVGVNRPVFPRHLGAIL